MTAREELKKMPNTTLDPRYKLLQTRTHPKANHAFIYGVVSTKVYCRPTCTARLARRANVIFFDTSAEARREGFRPCKRCRPDEGGFRGVKEDVVGRAIALLAGQRGDGAREAGMRRKSVGELAKGVGVSSSYLSRVFKQVMGVTVGDYVVEFERSRIGSLETERGTSVSEDLCGTDGPGEVLGVVDFDLDDWFLTDDYLQDMGSGGLGETSALTDESKDTASIETLFGADCLDSLPVY
ncbi:hypothetical protein BJY01DRAFT_229976 [Aspergillus pseudoustus]|uniref:Metal binding domain of Ada-domain-containing protein n=1 Tax=Aspergillus pseudoustus TaxID=1810923 RepID=A0ABR4IE48_9EURO